MQLEQSCLVTRRINQSNNWLLKVRCMETLRRSALCKKQRPVCILELSDSIKQTFCLAVSFEFGQKWLTSALNSSSFFSTEIRRSLTKYMNRIRNSFPCCIDRVSLYCCDCRMTSETDHEPSECKASEEGDYGFFQGTVTVLVCRD